MCENFDCLHKYAHEISKDYGLILNCKTRCNLSNMLEHFNVLKSCISEALIHVDSDIEFSNENRMISKNLFPGIGSQNFVQKRFYSFNDCFISEKLDILK